MRIQGMQGRVHSVEGGMGFHSRKQPLEQMDEWNDSRRRSVSKSNEDSGTPYQGTLLGYCQRCSWHSFWIRDLDDGGMAPFS